MTSIGFGSWAIGGGHWEWGWGPQDDADSIAAIQRALDLGINWIDAAAAYGLGHSEELVGRAIKGRRDQVIVATKCGLVWDDPKSSQVEGRLKGWSVRQEAENSLRRLGVDVIDLYQVHWPNPDADVEGGRVGSASARSNIPPLSARVARNRSKRSRLPLIGY